MSIDNKTAVIRMIWIIVSIITVCLSFLFLYIICKIGNILLYVVLTLFLILLIFRFLTLKYFKLEMTEDLISKKHDHPLFKNYKLPNLELPWYKINVCQLGKGFFFIIYILIFPVKKETKYFFII